jgi:hypothetical protein
MGILKAGKVVALLVQGQGRLIGRPAADNQQTIHLMFFQIAGNGVKVAAVGMCRLVPNSEPPRGAQPLTSSS